MRCDNCPLCPIAEDDACPIADTEYGIEHKDGMSGCKHPYNWCKKRADEYADYLGRMGEEMSKMLKEKDTPKKPVCVEDKMWCCPNCCNNLMFKWKKYPTILNDRADGLDHCLACNQRIDWSE